MATALIMWVQTGKRTLTPPVSISIEGAASILWASLFLNNFYGGCKMKKETNVPYCPLLGVPVGRHGDIIVDPLGSYTGVPEEEGEKPVQDADDL